MTLSISPFIANNNGGGSETVAANGGTTDYLKATDIDGSAVVALGITALMTLNASCTAGARVHVYGGPDKDHVGAIPAQTVHVPTTFKSPTVTGVSFSVLPGHKVYRVTVQNLDPVQTITGITVYAEPQVLS